MTKNANKNYLGHSTNRLKNRTIFKWCYQAVMNSASEVEKSIPYLTALECPWSDFEEEGIQNRAFQQD